MILLRHTCHESKIGHLKKTSTFTSQVETQI